MTINPSDVSPWVSFFFSLVSSPVFIFVALGILGAVIVMLRGMWKGQ